MLYCTGRSTSDSLFCRTRRKEPTAKYKFSVADRILLRLHYNEYSVGCYYYLKTFCHLAGWLASYLVYLIYILKISRKYSILRVAQKWSHATTCLPSYCVAAHVVAGRLWKRVIKIRSLANAPMLTCKVQILTLRLQRAQDWEQPS